MSQPPISIRNPATAAFLAWLIPGLGHYYQGRKGKAFLYAFCILGLYCLGMLMGEGKIVYWRWVNPLEQPRKILHLLPGAVFRWSTRLAGAHSGNASALRARPRSSGGSLAEPSAGRSLTGFIPGSASSSKSARSTPPSRACSISWPSTTPTKAPPTRTRTNETPATSPRPHLAAAVDLKAEGSRMIGELGPGLLACLAAGRRDQRRLLGVAPRIVAANLVPVDPALLLDPGVARRRDRPAYS